MKAKTILRVDDSSSMLMLERSSLTRPVLEDRQFRWCEISGTSPSPLPTMSDRQTVSAERSRSMPTISRSQRCRSTGPRQHDEELVKR